MKKSFLIIAIAAAIFSGAILSCSQPVAETPEVNVPGSDSRRAVLEAMLAARLPDGGLRITSNNHLVWINPYFGNLAVHAMLAAMPEYPDLAPEIKDTAEKWLLWYADHQQQDGSICDFTGTMDSYESSGKYDSTDSYTATYLVIALKVARLNNGEIPDNVAAAVKKAYGCMNSTMQKDGLTWATPAYKAKYLMDAIEVNQGLTAAVELFGVLKEPKLQKDAKKRLAKNTVALNKFYLKDKPYLAWAITEGDTVHQGFEKLYPDLLANSFAAACIPGLNKRYWQKLSTKQAELVQAICPQFYIAALRFGDHAAAEAVREQGRRKLETTPDLRAIYLDQLYSLLIISLDDPNFWPEMAAPTASSPLIR